MSSATASCGSDQPLNNRIPTGIDYLDLDLHGGQIPAGLHGLFGPIGVGKTTLGVNIAVEGALQLARNQATNGVWFFISIEEPFVHIQRRAVSHAARIARDSVDRNWDHFSHSECLRDYEHARASELKQDGIVLGERERFSITDAILGKHFDIVDLNMEPFANEQYVSLIRDWICHRLISGPSLDRVAGVVIDYAGVAVKRSLDSDYDRLAQLLLNFAEESRTLLAIPFGCPVWVIHQLTGEACKFAPGTPQHHQDAMECRWFSSPFDVCFALGAPEPSSAVFRIDCTKAPIEPPRHEPTLLQHDDDFHTVRQARGYRIDRNSGRIVPLNQSRIQIDEETRRKLRDQLGGE